jgi:hypothetical protein
MALRVLRGGTHHASACGPSQNQDREQRPHVEAHVSTRAKSHGNGKQKARPVAKRPWIRMSRRSRRATLPGSDVASARAPSGSTGRAYDLPPCHQHHPHGAYGHVSRTGLQVRGPRVSSNTWHQGHSWAASRSMVGDRLRSEGSAKHAARRLGAENLLPGAAPSTLSPAGSRKARSGCYQLLRQRLASLSAQEEIGTYLAIWRWQPDNSGRVYSTAV